MRTVYVRAFMRLPLGKQGENEAVQVVWPGIVEQFRGLYGSGVFTLTAKRYGYAEAYPVAVSTEGGDVVWLVRAADVASPGSGSCELIYTVDGVVAKSQTWSTYVAASISGDAPGEPPEDPAKAWFAAVQAQIGNLDDLTTKAKDNLVAAINEAAKTGSGDAGSIAMRTADGYIQYSTDNGKSWKNLIVLAELKGEPGQDGAPGAPGKDGTPGADGYSPTAKVEATADGAKITIADKTGTTEATVKNGKDGTNGAPGKDGADGAPGKDGTNGTNGITPTIGDNGNWYLGDDDTGKPSRGPAGQDGAGMDITGAAVGQIAKISAVDDNGVPTAWEPVNMPSGGSGGETWELIQSTTLEEDTASVVYSTDVNGNPFELKKMKLIITGVASDIRLDTSIGLDKKHSFPIYDYNFFPKNQTKNNPNIVGHITYCEKEVYDPLIKYRNYSKFLSTQLYQIAGNEYGGAFFYTPDRYPYRYIQLNPHNNGVFFTGCKIELYGVRA